MKKNTSIIAMVIVVGMILGFPLSAVGDPLDDLNAEKLAVSLVVDISGSMIFTDPNMLRERVVEVFIDMLNPDDYLGIVTFHSEVDLVIDPERMNGEATRNSFKERIAGRLQAQADTDYDSALKAAIQQLDQVQDGEARKLVIFLTDGKPDPDPVNITPNPEAMALYMDGVWETVGELAAKGYPVYSIGFSDDIDVDVLNRIASETGGDVRIYRDANELNENLIQVLGSREEIIQELLAPTIIPGATGKPVISNHFWPKRGGYRIGEVETVVASIRLGNRDLAEGSLLQVEYFDFVVQKEDGESFRLPLFDDGGQASGDIMAGDGRWTNRFNISSAYNAQLFLEAAGQYRGEEFSLRKDLGEMFSANPGNIRLENVEADLWVKRGETLQIPIRVINNSSFTEVLDLSVETEIGSLRNSQLEIGPEMGREFILLIDTEPGVATGDHQVVIRARAIYAETQVQNSSLDHQARVVGFFGGLVESTRDNIFLVALALGVFVGLPLLIFLLGTLFYGILVAPSLKIRGSLICWKENKPEDKITLDLRRRKKREVIVSMDQEDSADFHLQSTRYNYNMTLGKTMHLEGKKFILGWKGLFSRKPATSAFVRVDKPGIINLKGDITTQIKLYDGMEFGSGDYVFRYVVEGKRWKKDVEAGKDILEGRTNGF